MDDFTERLIEANKESALDDIGIPDPPTPDQIPQFWNYLVARAFYFNRHLYTHPNLPGALWSEHTLIHPRASVSDMQSLVRYYGPLSRRACSYIYEQILKHAPRLDRTKICIAPGVLWDLTNQQFIQDDPDNINTITDW